MFKKFSFGKNWSRYVKLVNEATIDSARESLLNLIDNNHDLIKGKTFLDIGCGSGLFMLAADRLGTGSGTGIDVDPFSVETSKAMLKKFGTSATFQVIHGSILDKELLNRIGKAEFVYAWGSLHHTGRMWEAISNAVGLVEDSGTLVLAIYNRHKTSGFWKMVKKTYNNVPSLIKVFIVAGYLMVNVPYKLIFFREGLRDENQRGMHWYYDALDWLGGWPYEYASIDEIHNYLTRMGLTELKTIPCQGMTGCNQFVYRKTENKT